MSVNARMIIFNFFLETQDALGSGSKQFNLTAQYSLALDRSFKNSLKEFV